jgi:peptidoglycan hydrolase-like protein with peptidoglycan-binding domain
MKKSFVFVVAVITAMFFVSGCETVPKKFKEEVAGIKSRVESLETKVEGVEAKQQEVDRTTSEQSQALEEMKSAKSSRETTNISVKPRDFRSKSRTKELQTCLKNAGFYIGKINGVKTKRTKKAIREFQKANGLKADGVVGPKTWELLNKYASGPAQAAATGADEGATK